MLNPVRELAQYETQPIRLSRVENQCDRIDFALVKPIFGFLNAVYFSEIADFYNLYILLALAFVNSRNNKTQSDAAVVQFGLNLWKISEITGIPRETVRRKIKLLVEMGYVDAGRDRTYLLAAEALSLLPMMTSLQSGLGRVI